ncbi:hypothetical protein [Actinomadura madurae]|uniref:hypothetical protein n=1 Tax=Actinomadura madurae TaxID=1993 RepID=UPI0020D223D5|nr:hypothetical protein [Actinomadura madurae]MCP9983215.1 hypothetical protein [Actinomadura madurae]
MIGVAPEARLPSLRVILERDERGFERFTGGERFTGTIRNSGVVVSAPGVAALIRSRHRGLAPALVTQAIVASTRKAPARGYDRGVGFGRAGLHRPADLRAGGGLAGAAVYLRGAPGSGE